MSNVIGSYRKGKIVRMKWIQSNYKQIEEYILNIPKFRTEGSIEDARKFYEFLCKPGKNSTIVHVAGTNGKGSTCAYINSVLTEAGIKTGMFTSPHLISVRERMRRNQNLISEQEFVVQFQKLMEQIIVYNQEVLNISSKAVMESLGKEIEKMLGEFQGKEIEKTLEKSQGKEIEKTFEESKSKEIDQANKEVIISNMTYTPTFYEFLFFMAMLYFEEQKVDVIILETGLGGRLDATNVIDTPKVTVITEIGMDHMEYLGNTYELIAAEKAEIIKPGTSVVYSAKRQETSRVIERKAKDAGVLCKCVEKLEKQDYRFVDKKIDFSFFSRYYGYIPIKLNTCAVYQVENAMLALNALEELELGISKEVIQEGMEKCKWEGRMEEILPGVYLDGAHNEDGIEAFLAVVKEDKCKGKRWLLFSAVADKEYRNMKEKLMDSGLFFYIYAAPLKNARGISKEELEYIFYDNKDKERNSYKNKPNDFNLRCIDKNEERKLDKFNASKFSVKISNSACDGMQEILSLKKENDFVYVTGSLYLVGEIKGRIEL